MPLLPQFHSTYLELVLLQHIVRLLDLFDFYLHRNGQRLDVADRLEHHLKIDQATDVAVQIQPQML